MVGTTDRRSSIWTSERIRAASSRTMRRTVSFSSGVGTRPISSIVAGVPLHIGTWTVGVNGRPASDGSRKSVSESWAWSCTASDSRFCLRSNSFTTTPMTTSRPTTTPTAAIAAPPPSAAGCGVAGGITGASLLPVTEGPTQLLPRVKVQRTFEFERSDGAWVINGEFFDENRVNARPRAGEPEIWILKSGGGWVHPVHIHLSDFFILSRDGNTPPPLERGRKETVLIGGDVGSEVRILIKFDDSREASVQALKPHTALR